MAAWIAVALLLVLSIALSVLWWWLPSSDALARRIEAEASARLGVPVEVGAAGWQLLPSPALEVFDVATGQAEPITLGRVAAYPELGALLRGELTLARLEIENAHVARESMRAFRGRESGLREQAAGDRVPVRRLVLRDVTYVSWSGVPVAYDGEIDFDPRWRPRHAEIRRPGAPRPASLTLRREGTQDRWQAAVQLAGGTAEGVIAVQEDPQGRLTLDGTLAPRRIEIAAAVDTFHRRSPISGLASGRTVLRGQGDTPGELVRSLRTRSELTVEQGVVLRLDLDRAVSTLGKERAGRTRLDSLAGVVETQNTEQGMRVRYSQLKATSGKYSASGEAVIFQRQIEASGTLDIVDGLVGVPFTVAGPTRKPDVKVPPGFFAGAAVGTAILPGIGTAIGARIGGLLGRAPAGERKTGPTPGGPRAR